MPQKLRKKKLLTNLRPRLKLKPSPKSQLRLSSQPNNQLSNNSHNNKKSTKRKLIRLLSKLSSQSNNHLTNLSQKLSNLSQNRNNNLYNNQNKKLRSRKSLLLILMVGLKFQTRKRRRLKNSMPKSNNNFSKQRPRSLVVRRLPTLSISSPSETSSIPKKN